MTQSINRRHLAKVLQNSLKDVNGYVRLVDCDIALDDLLTYITDCLAQGIDVRLSRFGKFSRKFKPARTCNDPRNPGSTLVTEAKNVAHFSAFNELQDAVKEARELEPMPSEQVEAE